MNRTLSPESLKALDAKLRERHRDFAQLYPGPGSSRQPVHTVYAGAQLFHADSAPRLGAHALQALDDYAPDFVTFAKAIGLDGANELPDAPEEIERLEKYIDSDPDTFRKESRAAWLALTIYRRVREKLDREPVEDFRIDFEDGYGNRPDDEEDAHAISTARDVPPERRPELCRRSSAFASIRSTRNSARAAFARSIYSSPRSPRPALARFRGIFASRCRK